MHFYGVPLFIDDVISGEYDRQLNNIPNDTDVLITHQPPFGILDFRKYKLWGLYIAAKCVEN